MDSTLSLEELTLAKDLKSQGKSSQEILGYIASKRLGAPSRISAERKEVPTQDEPYYVRAMRDIPQDILGGFKKTGEDLVARGQAITESFQAGRAGEQSPFETGGQIAGNILGGAGDIAFRGVQAAGSLPLAPETETAIGEGFAQGAEKTGLPQWFSGLSPRTQRNIGGALGLGEAATVGAGSMLTKPITRGLNAAVKTAEDVVAPIARTATRQTAEGLTPEVRQKAVTNLETAYKNSLVEGRTAINNKLDKIANDQSFGDTVLTKDDLVRQLAEEGYVPKIEGRLANMQDVLRDIETRQSEVMKALEPLLQQRRETITLDDLYTQVRQGIESDPRIGSELNQAIGKLDNIFDSYRVKYKTGELTADDVNRIKIEANQRRSDYGSKQGDPFITDAYANLARASNNWLNQNIPDELFKQTNAEWARLNSLKDVAAVFNNQQVDVGIFGRALGSYVTTVAASGAGISVAGPGGLVVAGILAKIGGDKIADILRNKYFNPKVTDQIRSILQKDEALKKRLMDTASKENQKRLSQLLLEAPKADAPRSEVRASGQPIATPGQTPTGRVEVGLTERSKPSANRRSDSEPRQTETERAIREDDDAVQQAVAEMEAEMTGQTRPSVGQNQATDMEGNFYRFNELPSWVPEQFRDGNLMAKVMENILTGKKPRGNAGLEMELQEIVEGHIKKRVAEIKKGQGDQGIFTGDAAFAVALMVGGTYFYLNNDGEMLPIVAIGSMMANPVARRAALASAKQAAKKGGKLPEPYKRKIAEALEEYDAGFVDVKENGVRRSIAPDEVDQRIAELQEKNFAGKFTDKDALEAEELMAGKGILLSPTDN
jgi:hypothetical protein